MLIVLYISVPGIGVGGFYAQCNKGVMFIHEAQGLEADLGECRFIEDQVIGRGHDKGSLGVRLQQLEGDIGDTRRGVLSGRLTQDIGYG